MTITAVFLKVLDVLLAIFEHFTKKHDYDTAIYKGRFEVVKLTWRCYHAACLCLLI